MKNILPLFFIMFFCLERVNAQSKDTTCVTDVLEPDTHTSLLVFPNPSTGSFQIIYYSTTGCPPAGWGGLLMINIINSNGETVYAEKVYDFEGEYIRTVDLSEEVKGTYIIEVVSGRQKKVKREILK